MTNAPAALGREQVAALQDAMTALPPERLLNIDDMTRHYFADGVYAREMVIPAGAVVVGKIHKTEHLCIISKGDITVFTEEGGRRRIQAPATFVSPPGTKRAVYAHAETVWTVVHPTHERDLDRIERQFIASGFDELEASGALGDAWVLEAIACHGA